MKKTPCQDTQDCLISKHLDGGVSLLSTQGSKGFRGYHEETLIRERGRVWGPSVSRQERTISK